MHHPIQSSAHAGLNLRALRAIGVDSAIIDERRRLDGRRALTFLAELPELVHEWQERLGVHGARLLPGGVLSAALACCAGDEPVVLKLSATYATSARAEAAAMAAWNGRGACRLRFASADGRAMLLDAIRPGLPVKAGDEREDARRASSLLSHLHLPSPFPEPVPGAADELSWRFERAHRHLDGPARARGLVDHGELDAALRDALSLHDTRPATVLCHGDFLDKNLLVDRRGDWWAIDPRPCRGDPSLDAAFWALAHRGGAGAAERAEAIARAAGLPVERVWAWMRVFAASEAVLVRDLRRARAFHAVLARSTNLPIR